MWVPQERGRCAGQEEELTCDDDFSPHSAQNDVKIEGSGILKRGSFPGTVTTIYVVGDNGARGTVKGCNGGTANWAFEYSTSVGHNTYDTTGLNSGRIIVSDRARCPG